MLSKFVNPNKLAYEFDVFGDFASDIAVGDSSKNNYCFIEFEDARANSIFVKKGRKYSQEFSPRLEHGFSQIIDWSYKLDTLQFTPDFEARFGSMTIQYEWILILGRIHYLNIPLYRRLQWRIEKTVIDSKYVYCYTFDDVYNILSERMAIIAAIS